MIKIDILDKDKKIIAYTYESFTYTVSHIIDKYLYQYGYPLYLVVNFVKPIKYMIFDDGKPIKDTYYDCQRCLVFTTLEFNELIYHFNNICDVKERRIKNAVKQ